ncbi:unnamed protein product [Polarella glacialis]|uniref:NAD(P)-binding domain-containing protein n=1 Tax=Polarella glacialis TaxID=89957 RepID=A0A813JT81_POLGL|nr:unnamed protein product [Polarella glacialis]CAE8688849.1 unnamed protein product [Polarella glacialis]
MAVVLKGQDMAVTANRRHGLLPTARRRHCSAVLVAAAAAAVWAVLGGSSPSLPTWLNPSSPGEVGSLEVSRRLVLAAGLATVQASPVWAEANLKLDQYGRVIMPDGSLARTDGAAERYTGSATFLNKPKVFVAGSTGELGRRVVLDMIRTGMSVYCGLRDNGKRMEMQYENRKSAKYEMTVVGDALIEGGRQKELEEQLADASVVVHVAGARFGFDVLRLGSGLDGTEAERTDLNGTIALVDAAVAKGVKKFIYVSAILVNAKALGEQVSGSDAYKNWNNYGQVLDKKLAAEEYIKKSGLDYTIIRPVPMTNDFPKDVGGIYFAKPDSMLLKQGEVGNKVSRDDVSLAILDAVFNEKASRSTFELVGVPKQSPTAREQWWVPQEGGKAR